mmetsp:Transcript_49185/g.110606  ORF Transcript_49185/g.110606 Transcript_49185/m.110606 type:complete len:98 (-) Transcript_49185:328-621(-)
MRKQRCAQHRVAEKPPQADDAIEVSKRLRQRVDALFRQQLAVVDGGRAELHHSSDSLREQASEVQMAAALMRPRRTARRFTVRAATADSVLSAPSAR